MLESYVVVEVTARAALEVFVQISPGSRLVAVNGENGEGSAQSDAANVLLGLVLSAAAGCIDGCWSSLTLTAKLNGVDNYGIYIKILYYTLL